MWKAHSQECCLTSDRKDYEKVGEERSFSSKTLGWYKSCWVPGFQCFITQHRLCWLVDDVSYRISSNSGLHCNGRRIPTRWIKDLLKYNKCPLFHSSKIAGTQCGGSRFIDRSELTTGVIWNLQRLTKTAVLLPQGEVGESGHMLQMWKVKKKKRKCSRWKESCYFARIKSKFIFAKLL